MMIKLKERKAFVENLCKEFGIAILYVFGSQSKEVANFFRKGVDISLSESDVDIGIKPIQGKRLTIKEKVLLALRLEEMLGAKRVDVVGLHEADPFLSVEIIRGERLFSLDEVEADEYELYILRRAGDQIPLEKERERLIFGEEK